MYSMDAKEFLLEYAALKMEAINHSKRIIKAFNDTQIPATHLCEGSRRTLGSKDRQENATIRYTETKDRLQPQIDANKAKMRQIEDAISSMTDGLEREVLRLRYIDVNSWKPVPWREVAIELYGDDEEKDLKRVQRLHQEALKSLTAVLEDM